MSRWEKFGNSHNSADYSIVENLGRTEFKLQTFSGCEVIGTYSSLAAAKRAAKHHSRLRELSNRRDALFDELDAVRMGAGHV